MFIKQQWRILDPTYNLYFDIGIENIIENPYCHRKVLHLYSDEFYTDSTQKHENFICTQIDANTRTTHKYNKEWFSFMGFYPFVPPIWYFHEHFSKETITLYDIRNDSRYILM